MTAMIRGEMRPDLAVKTIEDSLSRENNSLGSQIPIGFAKIANLCYVAVRTGAKIIRVRIRRQRRSSDVSHARRSLRINVAVPELSAVRKGSRETWIKHEAAAMLVRIIVMLSLAACLVSARRYARRELAQALLHQGISRREIPMWICIATHESGLDSDAVNRCNTDDSWDHGLWQINDKYWVGRDRRGGDCGFASWEVRGDNLANAVRCVQRILNEHRRLQGNGWMAWSVYSHQGHCQGDLSSYVEGCF